MTQALVVNVENVSKQFAGGQAVSDASFTTAKGECFGLLSDPELLILDEPTTGLNPGVRQLIWDKIEAFKRRGKTVLLTTHYMDEAEFLCDRLVILDNGAIKLQGAPRALIAEHCPGFVALWRKQYANPHFSDDDEATVSEPNRRLERSSLAELAEALDKEVVKPEVIRPFNLEDVFLNLSKHPQFSRDLDSSHRILGTKEKNESFLASIQALPAGHRLFSRGSLLFKNAHP
ncbi:MAG: hypothetical protein H7318_16495 [Oligoflexus sp.]|nr:hypothetical protein [Oligoflexus sp.]